MKHLHCLLSILLRALPELTGRERKTMRRRVFTRQQSSKEGNKEEDKNKEKEKEEEEENREEEQSLS